MRDGPYIPTSARPPIMCAADFRATHGKNLVVVGIELYALVCVYGDGLAYWCRGVAEDMYL